jgi:HEAT repeat protein
MAQAAQTPTPTPAPLPTLEQSFEALKGYKPADDPAVLIPIDQAVMAVHGNPAARAALEQRLAGYLGASYSSVTRSFVCRELAIIGSAASVPGLAPLLLDDELSVFARQALERIPGPEADKALRDAIVKSRGRTRIGIINSVAVRRDPRSMPLLVKAATDEPETTAAAAKALGEIGTTESAKALEAFRRKGTPPQRLAVADAFLICAERLIASGERAQAVRLLETLTDSSQPAHVRLAANRALSAAGRS